MDAVMNYHKANDKQKETINKLDGKGYHVFIAPLDNFEIRELMEDCFWWGADYAKGLPQRKVALVLENGEIITL